MSIQKKSLISTLKTAKKANVASDAKGEKVSSMRLATTRVVTAKRGLSGKNISQSKAVASKNASLKLI